MVRGDDVLDPGSAGQIEEAVPETSKHYIRADAAGNGSGTDWNNASRALPARLYRGHVYYVADGVYGSRAFNDPITAADLASNPYITIKKATASDHGTNVGWNSAFGDGVAELGKLSFDSDYYILDGARRASLRSGYGFYIKIKGSGADAYGVSVNGRRNITLRFLEITSESLNNQVSGIDGTRGNPPVNLTFQNLYIHYVWGPPIYLVDAQTILLENSVIADAKSTAAWHSEAIQARGIRNMTVRYNRFFKIEGTAVLVNGSGDARDWYIYGNVFDNMGAGVGRGAISDNEERDPNTGRTVPTGTISNVHIYNNVFTRFGSGTAGISFVGSKGNIRIMNNIWFDNPWVPFGEPMDGSQERLKIDYNYFAKCIFPNAFMNDEVDGKPVGPQYGPHDYVHVTDTGNGFATTNNADPFKALVNGDFTLKAALPMKGLGLAAPYNRDPAGLVRGADGTWDPGAYEFSARDVILPTVALTSPLANATVAGGIAVTANATDNVKVARVEFLVDGVLRSTDTAAGYYYWLDLKTLALGNHVLVAKAVDTSGNSASSTPVTIKVVADTQPPTLTIVSPTAGATISGLLNARVSVSDNVSVARVDYYIDGQLKYLAYGAPFAYTTFDTHALANGPHELKVYAYDGSSNKVIVTTTFNVRN